LSSPPSAATTLSATSWRRSIEDIRRATASSSGNNGDGRNGKNRASGRSNFITTTTKKETKGVSAKQFHNVYRNVLYPNRDILLNVLMSLEPSSSTSTPNNHYSQSNQQYQQQLQLQQEEWVLLSKITVAGPMMDPK
jgi:hypothetical protein